MRALWQDLRFAARLLGKAPGFSTAVLATIAVGIAANTTILGVADALFWQRLPVANADRIVHIDQRRAGRSEAFTLSMADYQDYRERSTSFDDLAAHYPASPMQLIIGGEPLSAIGSVVTANYFDVLGLTPAAGRFIRTDEDLVRGRDAVAVISDDLWQRKFNRDASAIGSTMQINGTTFIIVGVAPKSFHGALTRLPIPQVWIASAMFKVGYRYCDDAFARDCRIVWMLGRLKRGVPLEAAQQELSAIAGQLESEFPATNRGLGVKVKEARGAALAGADARVVSLLLTAVGVLLVVACANVAGLSIARGLSRRQEIAARAALGASRLRVIRQLLTESVFLALVGGGLGVLLAFWTIDIVKQFYATDYSGNPINLDVHISATAWLPMVAMSVLTGIVFGLAPAIRASGEDPLIVIRGTGAGSGTRTGLQRALVVAQVALSVVLVIGATLVVRSLLQVYRGQGFDPSGVILVRLRPSLVDYSFEQSRAYQRDAIARLEALPGVVSASPSVHFPVFGWGERVAVWTPGQAPERTEDAFTTVWDQVGPRYFKTLGIAMTEGREFDDRDRVGAPQAVIVNEMLARRLWPDQHATGQPIVVDGREHVVVGVASAGQFHGADDGERPFLYVNYWQYAGSDSFLKDSRTHIRVAGDPGTSLAAIRRALSDLDPAVPVSEDYPLRQRIALEFQPVRVAGTLFGWFGGIALFLSAIGLYGVLAFTTRQRRREIAIRLALGADRRAVMRQVLGEGARLALIGTALGLIMAVASARFLASLLYGVARYDVVAFAGVPLVLIAVAFFASYWPARGAARVDAAAALRAD